MTKLQNKIQELKKRELPVNYRSVDISNSPNYKEKLKQRIVCGYGVVWGSQNDYGERFVKGCFSKSINDLGPDSNSTYKIKFRDRHGKSCSLFAKLIEDEIGLYFETLPLDKVQWADDLLVQLESGTINNFSIGFKYCWDKVEWDDDNDCLVILECRLFEISAVDIPSDIKTFAMRSSENVDDVKGDIEDFISSLKKSQQVEARILFTRCFSLYIQEQKNQERQSLEDKKQKKTGINYKSLISKI